MSVLPLNDTSKITRNKDYEKKVHVKRCKSVNLIIKLKGHYYVDAFNANFKIKYFDL